MCPMCLHVILSPNRPFRGQSGLKNVMDVIFFSTNLHAIKMHCLGSSKQCPMCFHVNLGLNRPCELLWRSEQPLKDHGHQFFCTNLHSILCALPRRFTIAFKTMSHVFTCKSGLKQAILATMEVRTASKMSWTSIFLHQS